MGSISTGRLSGAGSQLCRGMCSAHLGVDKPAMDERDVQKIKDGCLGGKLKVKYTAGTKYRKVISKAAAEDTAKPVGAQPRSQQCEGIWHRLRSCASGFSDGKGKSHATGDRPDRMVPYLPNLTFTSIPVARRGTTDIASLMFCCWFCRNCSVLPCRPRICLDKRCWKDSAIHLSAYLNGPVFPILAKGDHQPRAEAGAGFTTPVRERNPAQGSLKQAGNLLDHEPQWRNCCRGGARQRGTGAG